MGRDAVAADRPRSGWRTQIEQAVKKAVEAEREACARVAERMPRATASEIANVIRARPTRIDGSAVASTARERTDG